jgi:hypothetical protein
MAAYPLSPAGLPRIWPGRSSTPAALLIALSRPGARGGLNDARRGNVVVSCAVGNHVDLRGLPGRTDGHRGAVRSRVGSPLGDSLARTRPPSAEQVAFRRAASRYREEERTFVVTSASRRRKEPKASAENTGRPRHPEELPIDQLENTLLRLRSSAGTRKLRSFDDRPTGGSNRPLTIWPSALASLFRPMII